MKIKVIVTLKNGVLDPQGKAIQQTLSGMGFETVKEVRQGKFFEIDIKEDDETKAKQKADEMCKNSLGVDSQMIWENGCKVKTPFCKKMFQAQCDCAVLEVKNHNMTKLPLTIIENINIKKWPVMMD